MLLLCITGSHSLWLLVTYIKGETPFPEFSVTFMLDDLTVGHYNSETKRYIPRDNTTNEDDIVSYIFYAMRHDLQPFHVARLTFKNYTKSMLTLLKYGILRLKVINITLWDTSYVSSVLTGPQLYQVMSHCELWDYHKPGQMISKIFFLLTTSLH